MKIKIIKIKPWMIKFSVDDNKYMIHENDDFYEPSYSLYKFESDKNGRYKLTYLAGQSGHIHGYDSRTKHGEPYKNIDIIQFIAQLCYDGFAQYVGVDKEYAECVLAIYKLKQIDKELFILKERKESLLNTRKNFAKLLENAGNWQTYLEEHRFLKV